MADKIVPPSLSAKSFSCPHCGAHAHQIWKRAFTDNFDYEDYPRVMHYFEVNALPLSDNEKQRRIMEKFVAQLKERNVTSYPHNPGHSCSQEMVNMFLSQCYSCKGFAVWIEDGIVYPSTGADIKPHDDTPDEIKADFVEASEIVGRSPRGAAAILRLCIQKLMIHLGEKGRSIDEDIGALVRRGLDSRIQKALDVVRVIGNNAVHPGQIDLRDDNATAARLFTLVNVIVEATIATPKHIEAMYDSLPEAALKAIEKRDLKAN